MSDDARERTSDGPLFQNLDEQERIYAPQQVPGAARPAVDAATVDTDIDREAVVGSEGKYEAPVIPAQSTIGTSQNMPVPPTAAPDLLTERDQERRDRAE